MIDRQMIGRILRMLVVSFILSVVLVIVMILLFGIMGPPSFRRIGDLLIQCGNFWPIPFGFLVGILSSLAATHGSSLRSWQRWAFIALWTFAFAAVLLPAFFNWINFYPTSKATYGRC